METETNITPILTKRSSRIRSWLLSRKRAALRNDTPFWRTSLIGLWLVSCTLLVIASLGMPTGMGAVIDSILAIVLGTIGMAIIAPMAAFLLAVAYLPLPRLYTGGVIYVSSVVFIVFYYANTGILLSAILTGFLTIYGIVSGLTIALLISRRVSRNVKAACVLAVMASVLAYTYWPVLSNEALTAADTSDDRIIEAVNSIQAANPAEQGSYRYSVFAYGSGEDRHRAEFADEASLISDSVDASAYIDNWSKLRAFYWGFDQKELPVNGRVWMPEGEGPYPLVLMVHGNHLMEQFSDEGYAYLGEMLASRGYIAVSVDENFLNYSVWQNIPDDDMKVRAWMLLKHLQQIAAFNNQSGTPFFNRVNLDQVALIGHSRGGQAVAMAADRNRWFTGDRSFQGLDKTVRIQAVVAIAPTDKSVNKQSAALRNVHYLSLQGAMDGDVNNFYGERQYLRTSFTSSSDKFKATLYIGEANHSQFNTEWGSMDDSLPGGLLLNREGMLEPEEQRQVAKVYISAFLETALHGKKEYTALFRDYRTGLAWLPEATYFNRFENNSFRAIARFDEDRNGTTGTRGVTAEASGLKWSEQKAEDRDGNSKGTRGLQLEWEDRGSYTLHIPELRSSILRTSASSSLTFALTSLEHELEGAEEQEAEWTAPAIEIELESGNGESVRLPLAHFMPVLPLPRTDFTLYSWMEERVKNGKYKEATEPVFQTFLLPLGHFKQANSKFDPSGITRVTFYFGGTRGKVMLDDIGITD
ncbi:alpha/beta hydrolase [Paenibacillus oenotherae]|uniref:Alpha/beta hydrolase n=1 Tax=Paenibacillus oenotherae TaxID=1435645 RepID=A0ABS7D9F6_9BACL|nr:alpha/beta hydrolase [Paenibacillus oenotherae]MBW7476142.1 alpha/beta hydrolase [Paenibacillus oenotherae]